MSTPALARLAHVRSVVSARPLGDYLAGRFLAMVGVWIFRVTIGWVVWDTTESPTLLGAATAALLAPQTLLAPFAGVIADRRDRKRVLQLTNAGNGTIKCLTGILALSGLLSLEVLFGCIVMASAAGALDQASAKTTVASLVAEGDVTTAISINSVLFNLAGFIGPAVAGAVIALTAPWLAFLLSGVLSLLFVVSLKRVPALPPVPTTTKTGFLSDIASAARYVVDTPLIRWIFLLHVASATLARPFMDFIPGIVGTLFDGGAFEVAMMTSAVGLGAICGGLWLAQRDNSGGVLPVVLRAFVALSLVLVACAWSPYLWLSVVLAATAGFGMIIRAAGLQTLLQTEAEKGMRGRVIAFYGMVLNGGAILGAMTIGFLGERFGLSIALTTSVSAAMVVFLVVRGPLTRAARRPS
jgi:MFS family permease